MFWKKKSKADRIANKIIQLAFDTGIGKQEETVAEQSGIDVSHYHGVVLGLCLFSVEYSFFLWAESCRLPEQDLKDIDSQYWNYVAEQCLQTPDPKGTYNFLTSCCNAFAEAHHQDEKNAAEGLVAISVSQLFGSYLTDPPDEAPVELTFFAPERIHLKITATKKALSHID